MGALKFQTTRLLLRPWQDSDAAALYTLAKDPDIGPAAGWPVHVDEADSLRVIREVLSAPDTYAILRREDGALLGSIGRFPNTAGADPAEPEIGYWVGKPYWGRGFCPEAVRALLADSFAHGIPRVWCAHYEGNHKSRRVIEKCGFTYRFQRQRELPLMGERRNALYYAIDRGVWED